LIFNLHEFIFYSITLHSLCKYIVVFRLFGFLDLNLKKQKNIKKTIKTKKTKKKQISNLKNHWFFPPLIQRQIYSESNVYGLLDYTSIDRIHRLREQPHHFLNNKHRHSYRFIL